jgi:hypothetical protein
MEQNARDPARILLRGERFHLAQPLEADAGGGRKISGAGGVGEGGGAAAAAR